MKTLNVTSLFSNYNQLRENAFFPETQEQAKEDVLLQLNQLVAQGYNTFIIGMVDVFDIFVSSVLIECREQYPELQCFVVVYQNQHSRFSPNLIKQANKIAVGADCTFCTSKKYHNNVFYFPNEYLINTLNMSVCYCHQYGDGGVLYTYRRDPYDSNISVELIDIFDYLNEESPLNTELK